MKRTFGPLAFCVFGSLACGTAGEVFVSPSGDAQVAPDATTPDLGEALDSSAAAPDAGSLPDAAPAPDANTPLPDGGATPAEWRKLPGLAGGRFRHIGDGAQDAYFLGKNLSELNFSLYRLEAGGASQKLGRAPDNLPVGEMVALGSTLWWATDLDGVYTSQDGGQTFFPATIPWEDGTVGMNGNGHVSRLVNGWRAGANFCVHRETTPWVNFHTLDDQRRGEVRCVDSSGGWSVVTATVTPGVRFFTAFDQDLYGFDTSDLQDPKLCHSADLGVHWSCTPTTVSDGLHLLKLASGRLVINRYVTQQWTFTEFWYSDDDGQTWHPSVTLPLPVEELRAVGDTIYCYDYSAPVAGELITVDLSGTGSYQRHHQLTGAQIDWVDPFVLGGAFHFADTRGVHRYDAIQDNFTDVPLETLPAIDVTIDAQAQVWAIDGTNTARRLSPGHTQFDELYFDDTGWGVGNILYHAAVIRMALVNQHLFLGAAHEKLYEIDVSGTSTTAQEDLTFAGVSPDAMIWKTSRVGNTLLVAATGGADQNHGTGERFAWGGGFFRKNVPGGAWVDMTPGLPQRIIDNTRGAAIVGAISGVDTSIVVATQEGVYHSADLGQHWAAVHGIPVYDATVEATTAAGIGSTVLLARQTSAVNVLYFSADGESFSHIITNLPNAPLRSLSAFGTTFYAILDGAGVYASGDQGQTWVLQGALPSGVAFPARAYAIHVDGARILAGTSDGVWQLDLGR
ncbi:MAG: sialidase family protein [Myxococcota bacterium]